jgi:hypothetical protein
MGLALGVRGVEQVVNVAVGTKAAEGVGTRRGDHGVASGADGNWGYKQLNYGTRAYGFTTFAKADLRPPQSSRT